MEKHRLRKQQRHQQHEQRKLSNSGEARDEWTPLPKSMLSVLPDPRRWPTPKAVMIQRAMAPALMANLNTTSEESSPTSLQLLIDDWYRMPCHVIQLFLYLGSIVILLDPADTLAVVALDMHPPNSLTVHKGAVFYRGRKQAQRFQSNLASSRASVLSANTTGSTEC